MSRKAKKDFTFSNGLTIPAGYTVAVASEGIHTDPVGQKSS
jgi:cytochrome P450